MEKKKYEINIIGEREIRNVHHIGVSCEGSYYSVIFGKYMNGGFCSIQNWGVACELSFDFRDLPYNEKNLHRILKRKDLARAIALAIAEFEESA